jgi:hypothetical protein
MRSLLLIALTVVFAIAGFGQTAPSALQSELQDLHAKWFKAYDDGDGVTMDQMEMDNLVLVMPTGEVWTKTKPRGTSEPKLDPTARHTLSDVLVRRFGNTAVLTGTITSQSKQENTKVATTVVFVGSPQHWKIASAQWTPVSGTK